MLTLAGITAMNSSYGHGNSYQLRTIGSSRTPQAGIDSQRGTNTSNLRLRPDQTKYDVGVEHRQRRPAGEQDSLASDGSEQMIIRRDTHIHVARDDQPAFKDV